MLVPGTEQCVKRRPQTPASVSFGRMEGGRGVGVEHRVGGEISRINISLNDLMLRLYGPSGKRER